MNPYKASEYAKYDNENQGWFGWSFGLAMVITVALLAAAVVLVFAVFYLLLSLVTRWVAGPDPGVMVGEEDLDADHVKTRVAEESDSSGVTSKTTDDGYVPADEITPWRWWQG